ncbi:thiamine pyrophosphate-dependent enzyme [Rhodococcus sp. IEGM 1401]|uniref:thiamine pyrophosphate-dependent enzyme n=1 Tax=unclassified Rhodococcus (in: high G+C Gram-positive bacteria) TaxID=192944 RepID=UPI0022B2E7E5|nr:MULTISPECIES: thiamine pyrophosphate-dependent enzyme [unclassified Rhodococcus (in: high G+C Gram-positive bacteria)]MCZ4562971.1 thiamine pyrophosphate-dependent enzyme [Rhodococcus sp. IEGM 1401]MDI9923121.1 thiamine pyrophosphate-dependent enzyme [Rhodococcus sp. IEGM 1372]MDV8035668.1 thiamine pyrophosphate-dependent enzyme [Rhodococcus sp. IEGM 1414]
MQRTYDELSQLMTLMTCDEKHSTSATSTLDVLWVLYSDILRLDPTNPDDPNRDRFYLSKGHGPMAYYAVLAARGFLTPTELASFGSYHSRLGSHPDRTLIPGVDIGSGSLGHGLALAAGTAVALRIQKRIARVFVLIGDAELDEGSNMEAIQFAARSELGNLTAVVIDNDSAGLGWPEGIASRFAVEGWLTSDVDGRDHSALRQAFRADHPDRPHVVVAHVEKKES